MRIRPRSAASAGITVAAMALAALSAPGVALAGTTTGNGSILGGEQISVPITVPINICGNAIAVLGIATAHCQGGASARTPASTLGSTSGSGSVGGGNQVSIPVTVPVNVCGNAVGVLGVAKASCSPHRLMHQPPPPPPPRQPKPPTKPPHRVIHHHHKPPTLQRQVAEQLPKGGMLPITGVNLAGLGGGALGLIAAGVMGMIGGRRRI